MLRPGYLAALAGCMALVLGAFAWLELHSSRRIVETTLEEGAVSLVQAVARAGENALRADAAVEMLVVERLRDNARNIALIDARGGVTDSLLAAITLDNDLLEIDVIGADGRWLASSTPPTYRIDYALDDLQSLLEGDAAELVFGFDAEELYAVAIRRSGGGAVIVRAPISRMLALRLSSGTGRLIQEIGSNPGVVYMVLQDTLGILSASRGVEQLDRISGDPFLEQALAGKSTYSRRTNYGGTPVFETVMPFRADDESLGLLRVGLSVEDLQAEEARDKLQLVLLAGLLLVLGVGGAGVVIIRQNYALLDEAYERVQTYSSQILEQMADAVVAVDPAGRVQVFNETAKKLFDHDADTALGRPYGDVLGFDLPPLQATLATETEATAQACEGAGPGGGKLSLAVSTSLIRNARGEVETVVAVIQDLTEKVAMEAEMRRQDRLVSMGALASGVAHEVRNPLNAIALLVQRLGREFEPVRDREQYHRFITVVREEIQRVNRIVKQFLGLARPPKLQPVDFNLEELLHKVIEVIAPRARLKSLRVEGVFAGVGTICADPEQVEQALLNLLGNAVEATETGHVGLSAAVVDGEVEVIVEDSGSGIPVEYMERIFDLYFTTKQEGTGLGLSLVHRIVTEHGGRIDVQSLEGRGSRFTIRLPRLAEVRPGAAASDLEHARA